jgi:hypothetical protein
VKIKNKAAQKPIELVGGNLAFGQNDGPQCPQVLGMDLAGLVSTTTTHVHIGKTSKGPEEGMPNEAWKLAPAAHVHIGKMETVLNLNWQSQRQQRKRKRRKSHSVQ